MTKENVRNAFIYRSVNYLFKEFSEILSEHWDLKHKGKYKYSSKDWINEFNFIELTSIISSFSKIIFDLSSIQMQFQKISESHCEEIKCILDYLCDKKYLFNLFQKYEIENLLKSCDFFKKVIDRRKLLLMTTINNYDYKYFSVSSQNKIELLENDPYNLDKDYLDLLIGFFGINNIEQLIIIIELEVYPNIFCNEVIEVIEKFSKNNINTNISLKMN